MTAQRFSDLNDTTTRLEGAGYLADPRISTAALLAAQLERPLLVEGPAGVGKTDLARAMAEAQGLRLIRLQCYEGIDESRALYEWDYGRQLLYSQLLKEKTDAVLEGSGDLRDAMARLREQGSAFFSEDFLLERPLLAALRSEQPCLLLLDEIDKADPEFEAFLLELLSDFQVSLPELGTLKARHRPQVLLTSNAARELSDPLKRRCLHLSIAFPDAERERAILLRHLPDLDARLATSLVGAVHRLRALDLRKVPSISEVIDWARAVTLLGRGALDEALLTDTLGVLLKHQADVLRAEDEAAAIVLAGTKAAEA